MNKRTIKTSLPQLGELGHPGTPELEAQLAAKNHIANESERMANEPVKKLKGTRAKGAAAIALTHEDWVDVYKGILDKSLIAAATKAEEGIRRNSGENWRTVQLTSLYINNKLPVDHTTGAVAEVGIEINIRENGVQRLLMRKMRYFKTMVQYTAGRDQGMFEALQDVFEDLFTFAIASDMAMRHEKNSMQPKSH